MHLVVTETLADVWSVSLLHPSAVHSDCPTFIMITITGMVLIGDEQGKLSPSYLPLSSLSQTVLYRYVCSFTFVLFRYN